MNGFLVICFGVLSSLFSASTQPETKGPSNIPSFTGISKQFARSGPMSTDIAANNYHSGPFHACPYKKRDVRSTGGVFAEKLPSEEFSYYLSNIRGASSFYLFNPISRLLIFPQHYFW